MSDFNTKLPNKLAYIKAQLNCDDKNLFYDSPIAQTISNVFSEFISPTEGVGKLHQILAKITKAQRTIY